MSSPSETLETSISLKAEPLKENDLYGQFVTNEQKVSFEYSSVSYYRY